MLKASEFRGFFCALKIPVKKAKDFFIYQFAE
jgi:hypothetical protein